MRGQAAPRGAGEVAPTIEAALVLAVLSPAAAPSAPGGGVARPSAGVVREVRLVMGTTAEVRATGLADSARALDDAFAALALVDERLSLWKESELAALNRAGSGAVSAETLAVLRHALEVAADSGGAFDPTVEPLVRAAGGFGAPPRALAEPERRALLARVGYERIHMESGTAMVRLAGGARVVLDGLAKGYAADLALARLRAEGATSGLVDIGGSSLAVFGETLVLDLRDPTGAGRPWASFRVEEAAVSTSGGDQRPGHILDPRTGRPATGLLQATVVADAAMEADALSTAVFVLGPEAGLRLLERRSAAGIVLSLAAGRRLVRATPGFSARFALKPAPGVSVRE